MLPDYLLNILNDVGNLYLAITHYKQPLKYTTILLAPALEREYSIKFNPEKTVKRMIRRLEDDKEINYLLHDFNRPST